MNTETYTPLAEQSIYKPTRKTGYIVGFSESNDDYLKAISDDLALDATIDEMHRLQKIFNEIARTPTVADLYFAFAGLRKEKINSESNAAFAEAAGCTAEVLKLLVPFFRRYREYGGDDKSAPSLTSLAEYAATGKIGADPCGIEICRADSVMMPLPYSGASETVRVDDFLLTLSSGRSLSRNSNAEACVILSPAEGEDLLTFTDKAHNICRKLVKEFPNTKIISASERGLIYDLLEHSDGYLIDTSLYPTPKHYADSVFEPFNPSLILFLSRNALMQLWVFACEVGITVKAPISMRTNLLTVQAAEGNVQYEKSFLKLLKADSGVTVSYKENADHAKREDIAINGSELEYKLSVSNHYLSARYVGGEHLYEDIADAMEDSNAVYAITGTVSATDGSFIQSILTLDSYRRNCSPTVVYSRFFTGEKTQICVLKLKAQK